MTINVISKDIFEKIGREKTLAEHAYDQLKEGLVSGSFQPGMKITGRLVASALDVSLTPAREAISRLLAEGALEATGPRTICVPVLTQERYDEITQIRLLTEIHAATLATKNLTESDIHQLEQIQVELNAALDSQDVQVTLMRNRDFHYTIYNASQLPKLVAIIESLWLQVGPLLNYLYPEYQRDRVGASHHKEALSAIHASDAEALGEAIRADIQDGYKHMSAAIARHQSAK